MIALYNILALILQIYTFILLASVIFSWLYAFNIINMHHPFVRMIGQFLYRLTEPLLAPIRRMLPNLGAIDISPLVLILIIWALQQILARLLLPSVIIGY